MSREKSRPPFAPDLLIRALGRADIPAGPQHVAIWLVMRCSQHTGATTLDNGWTATIRWLIANSKMRRSAVHKHLRWLERAGFVRTIAHYRKDGARLANTHELDAAHFGRLALAKTRGEAEHDHDSPIEATAEVAEQLRALLGAIAPGKQAKRPR